MMVQPRQPDFLRLRNEHFLQTHIMLVEPEPHVRAMLGNYLRGKGYAIAAAAEIETWYSIMNATAVDVLVVNPACIPRSASTLQRLPAMPDIPVIALCELDEDLNRLSALGCRPDARLSQPVQPRKLLVTIRQVLGAARIASCPPNEEHAKVFRFAGWTLYTDLGQLVSHEGKTICLSATEHRVMRALLTFPNLTLSRKQLLEAAAPHSGKIVSDKSVEITIARLRRHLGDNARFPFIIKTIHKVGYRLDVPIEKAP